MKGSDRFDWCREQRRGIRLVKPSISVCEAYLAKSESALNVLVSAREKDEPDWVVTTAYYAKYFALYAVLARCGIKCEIHACTLTAAERLLVDNGLMAKQLHEDILEAKDLRVEMQYYAYQSYDKNAVTRQAGSSPDFVLAMRALTERLDERTIDKVRERVSS